jgi:hypothetical protein
MNMTFKAFMMKQWTLTDDRILVGSKEIMLSSITRVEHSPLKNGKATMSQSNGVIQVFYGTGAFDFATLSYPAKQNEDGVKAAEYIMSFVGGEETKKRIEKQHEIREKGFRKRCNLCGKIFCYTYEDLEENKRLAKSAVWSSVGTFAGALSGNYAAGATSNQTASDELSRIVDYTKCPNCGSRDLTDIYDEDIAQMNAQQNNGGNTVSAADELKKFKELLDMGVISQEEFDQKKKQLLGL